MYCYLCLEKDILKTVEKEATETAKREYGINENKKLVYENLDFDIDRTEMSYNEGKILCFGNLELNGKILGFLSVEIPVETDLTLNIIESYMKKLGRLKTILEATK